MELELDAKGICKIIEQCKLSGVARLQAGDLIVDFDPNHTFNSIHTEYTPNGILDLTEPLPPGNVQEIAAQGKEDLVEMQRQEYLDQLILEDPEKYEEMMANGEIDDESRQPG